MKKLKRGFTLIELVVVMAVIAILSALMVTAIMGARRSAAETAVKADANTISLALETYYTKYKKYPIGWHGLYQCAGTGDTCESGSSGLNIALVNNSGSISADSLRLMTKRGNGRYCGKTGGQGYVLWTGVTGVVAYPDLTGYWGGDGSTCDSFTMPTTAFDFSSN